MFENLPRFIPFNDIEDFNPLLNLDDMNESIKEQVFPDILPLLPLKNTVLYPGVVIPVSIGREKSLKAVQRAFEGNKLIGAITQRDPDSDSTELGALYTVGTVAQIVRILKFNDGTSAAILHGKKRFKLDDIITDEPFLQAQTTPIEYQEAKNKEEFNALIMSVREKARAIIELSQPVSNDALLMMKNITNDIAFLNFVASNLNVKVTVKQSILEINSLRLQSETILMHMDSELQLLQLKSEIENKVRFEMDKQQRDYFLNQQLKTIQEELGGNSHEEEIKRLTEKAVDKKWKEEVAKHFEKELNKLRRMVPQAPEYSIQVNYLDTMCDLPWEENTPDNFDIPKIKKILDKEHFGLNEVKERIIEHLAVLKLKGDMKAPILLLVGPPGVGKTSLGKSVAKAMKRKYVRMSLGGLQDEAEIRGHRKTYIGALPGRIIQNIKKAGSNNPVFILDEIDKVGNSFRGDPSSALLEVLDPEQNANFYDNYLEVEYDLSKVLFFATANALESIQPALRDRMEVLRLSGYSTEEKIEIAKNHLVPDQRKEHGLKPKDIKVSETILTIMIQNYTRESGVRSLDRRIAQLMRSVAKKVAMNEKYNANIKDSDIIEIFGPASFSNDEYEENPQPGIAVGLAWTSVGGDILFIEAALTKGKGSLSLTGNLGTVMKESANTAMNYLKIHAEELGIDRKEIDESDVYIHVPEGAIPKDGPSAGITMLTALASAFKKKPLRPYLAMTGEITLRGKVLPVGGIKEKILAAKRAGCKEIILCHENFKDVNKIDAAYIEGIHFHYVKTMSEVIDYALKY